MTMTKQEAIQAMREGKKVTHRFFQPDEWVTWVISGLGECDDMYITEDGCRLSSEDFWTLRTDPAWETGWEIYFEK